MAEWPDGIEALGDRAIRLARPPAASAGALVHAIRAWPGVADVVVTPRHVAVYFTRPPKVPDGALAALAALEDDAAAAREVELRAVYDGPDLDEVARACGLPAAAVIERHASGLYVVETMGFSPGFAYLAGLDPRLELPRRATPRTRIPAGALAIAGGYTGVYPFASPGGWHLLGRVVDGPMFGPDGARLQLGDRVRFARSAP